MRLIIMCGAPPSAGKANRRGEHRNIPGNRPAEAGGRNAAEAAARHVKAAHRSLRESHDEDNEHRGYCRCSHPHTVSEDQHEPGCGLHHREPDSGNAGQEIRQKLVSRDKLRERRHVAKFHRTCVDEHAAYAKARQRRKNGSGRKAFPHFPENASSASAN